VVLDQSGEVSRAKLGGEFDVSSANDLRKALADVVGDVVLDCASLTFVDSSGIAELILPANRVASLTLVRCTPMLLRVLAALGLSERFHVLGGASDYEPESDPDSSH
jgi:anti-anti-sigma factor